MIKIMIYIAIIVKKIVMINVNIWLYLKKCKSFGYFIIEYKIDNYHYVNDEEKIYIFKKNKSLSNNKNNDLNELIKEYEGRNKILDEYIEILSANVKNNVLNNKYYKHKAEYIEYLIHARNRKL